MAKEWVILMVEKIVENMGNHDISGNFSQFAKMAQSK